MDTLQMCRICLAQNVRMNVVANKDLHEVYGKLSNVPFVTEDSRPILACFICCAQLKKCYRFKKKCLEAEVQFAKMMNEEYERKPLTNQDQFELFHGFIRTPIESINIVDGGPIEVFVKEELPAVCERLDDIRSIIEKEEHLSDDDQEAVNYRFTVQNNCLKIEYVPPRHCESDSDDNVPIMNDKTEVEEENKVPEVRRKVEVMSGAPVVKKPRLEDEITAQQSETDTEMIKDDQNSTFIEKKPKLEDIITTEQSKINPEMIQDEQNSMSKSFIATNSDVQSSFFNNTVVDIDYSTNTNGDISLLQEFKPYECDLCHNNFKRKSDLLIHKQIHTGEKPFKCHICERSFSRKNNLVKHIRVHTGEKPYKCDVCERSFTERCNLTKHIRVHMGEKLYKCNLCSLSFSQNVNLKSHIQAHTGEKPFKCDTCPSSFSHKADLCKHIRVHTGEKPFKCEICQSSFTQKANLTRHIRTHT